LPLTIVDEAPTPVVAYRHWTTGRATSGDVVVTYRAIPHVITFETRSTPDFDLRAEAGGISGAGLMLLALPDKAMSAESADDKTRYNISLHWDLTDMPAAARGVWSTGEGDVNLIGTPETIADTFYMAGPVKSIPEEGKAKFGFYWLSQPHFDVITVAKNVKQYYDFAAKFFHEPDSDFRVFLRKNPSHAHSGTALNHSFMMGWNDYKRDTPQSLHALLAHEVTHNWPHLQGDYGDVTWYDEGGAEYYSILLSRRAGIYDDARFLKELNERASTYYRNPQRALNNSEVQQLAWKNPLVVVIPYGRGLIYLACVDAEIRAKSGGKRGLDDLVLALLDKRRKGEPHTNATWVELLTRELGPRAKTDFDAMMKGELVAPTGSFAPCFAVKPIKEPLFELGFEPSVLNEQQRVVKGLVLDSAAARSGLKDGDLITDFVPLPDLREDSSREMVMKIRRDGAELTIHYRPEGALVDSFHWVDVPEASKNECKL
jgi:predicted metalloprotease with PDZ domain